MLHLPRGDMEYGTDELSAKWELGTEIGSTQILRNNTFTLNLNQKQKQELNWRLDEDLFSSGTPGRKASISYQVGSFYHRYTAMTLIFSA
jgi:hypothetical protein